MTRQRYIRYGKIVLSIITSYVVTMYLMQTIFINPLKPEIDKQRIKATTVRFVNAVNIFKPTTNTLSQATGFFSRFRLKPALIQIPTPIPTTPPIIIEPTSPPPPSPTNALISYIPPATSTPIPVIPTNTQISNCPTASNESYGSIGASDRTDRPAESHPDLNLHIRGYAPVSEEKRLVDLSGDTDNRAPQLTGLLAGSSLPEILNTYRVYEWNWSNNTKGGFVQDWEVTLIGLRASPGQEIRVPPADYDIGGAQAMVLYAEANQVTIKYTREDNVVVGYAIHLDDICVDPNLVAKYNSLNSSGRGSLPSLPRGKKIGIAKSSEVKVAIRDTGQFMDPRSRKDWWAK